MKRSKNVSKIQESTGSKRARKNKEDHGLDSTQQGLKNESEKRLDSQGNTLQEEPEQYFFLIKAEPESRIEKGVDVKFSIQDLQACTKPEPWSGVRNYEARNIMRDKMKLGHLCFFYHSNCKVPGIVGLARVVKEAYPDYTALDPKHPYFDPKSKPDVPKWCMVDVEHVQTFPRLIPLKELQGYPELAEMSLIKRGRLSVQVVRKKEFDFIMKLVE